MTLRVDPNGFFLYWTGPNMVRVRWCYWLSSGPLWETLSSSLVLGMRPSQELGIPQLEWGD